VMTAPVATAQCAPGQVFGNTGLAMLGAAQVEVLTGAAENAGNEIGMFWRGDNSNFANNFGGTCPSTNVDGVSSWWVVTMAGNRGVSGGITINNCLANSCPGATDEMVWTIEEWGAGGPPGVGDTAYFIGWRVDATPADPARYWDLSRPTGEASLNLLEFPVANVTGSLRAGTDVNTTQAYADVGLNFYGQNAGGAIADSATIKQYDVCTFVGASDPGRDRSSWTCSQSVPYADAAASNVPVVVDCADTVNDTWVAIGVTFSGGAGPDVPSNLVGKATAIECDPNLADPDETVRPKIRPKKTRRTGR